MIVLVVELAEATLPPETVSVLAPRLSVPPASSRPVIGFEAASTSVEVSLTMSPGPAALTVAT